MATYLSQKELVKQIEANLNALEAGTLGLSEIEGHIELVRELYERSIVLRYKAFEQHSTIEVSIPVVEEVVPIIAAQEQTPIIKQDEELEEEISYETATVSVDEVEEEDESDFEFDFFSTNEHVSEGSEIPTFEPETKEEITFSVEEKEEIIPIVEEEISETSVNIPTTENIHSTLTNSNISERVFQIEREISNQMAFNTLPTLVGSFGLNERLLYINELFDGSSESFSDAIKQLDTKNSLQEAMPNIESIAVKFNWDLESEIVEEFIQKLCRRYA